MNNQAVIFTVIPPTSHNSALLLTPQFPVRPVRALALKGLLIPPCSSIHCPEGLLVFSWAAWGSRVAFPWRGQGCPSPLTAQGKSREYEPSHTTTSNAACPGAQDQGCIAWVTSKPPSITPALIQASSQTGKHREGFPWKAELSPSHGHDSAKNPCFSCCRALKSWEMSPLPTWSSHVV